MRTKEELVNATKDSIANRMLQAIWQELFTQDYSDCLIELKKDHYHFDGKTYVIMRSHDLGDQTSYAYDWSFKCLTTEGSWTITFRVTDSFSITMGGDECLVTDFQVVDSYNYEFDGLMRDFIEFVTHITTTYHPGGAVLRPSNEKAQ